MINLLVLIDKIELQISVLAESSFKYDGNVLIKTRCAHVVVYDDKVVTCLGTGKVILVRRLNYGVLTLCEVAVFGGMY